MSNARETLEKARFFLQEARDAAPVDRKRLEKFVEAAVVFGRSVTFHLQKEFSHQDGFDIWYAAQQQRMREDPLCGFFLSKRNFILKEGPVSVRKTIIVTINEAIALSSSFSAKVTRSRPWYRRSARILVQDLLSPFREAISKWKARRRRQKRRRAAKASKSRTEEILHFEDPGWNDRSALDLIGEYLAKLEPVVADAEGKFGKVDGSAFS